MARRELYGKRVLLTGGSSGIGKELCKRLLQRGAIVMATARRSDRLQLLMQECSEYEPNLSTLSGDIVDPIHRAAITDWISSHWGSLDILVNNAGVGAIGAFEGASSERLRQIMDVNFFAPAELTRHCIPWLKLGKRPAILNIGSVLSHRAVPYKSEYCAAKFALRGWAESLRVELMPDNIDVLMLSPSTTRSEFFDALVGTSESQKSKSIGSMSPVQVADAAISVLIQSKRERILSLGGRCLVWAGKFIPSLTDRMLARFS